MIAAFVIIIVAVVALDLITKFSFDGILNWGISWSLGADIPWLWILVVMASFALVAVLMVQFFMDKRKNWVGTVGMALFIGGALGNAIDRLISHGPVHDFINFGLFKNNLADIALSVGAVLILISYFIREKQRAAG